ncbi:MAG: hypothetical protein ACI9OU_000715 [Candidatus Promineifilaceae bacterium]|jgi:hypothetical protein
MLNIYPSNNYDYRNLHKGDAGQTPLLLTFSRSKNANLDDDIMVGIFE